MTFKATFTAPDFGIQHGRELKATLNDLCDPICTHVLMLIIMHSDFKTGWFLGSYARLIALSTPPVPERGPRRAAPSLQEMRSAIERLIAANVLWRDASNLHNKQLRLRVWPRDVETASSDLTNSYLNRADKHANLAFMRVSRPSRAKTQQLSQQGYQELNSIPPTPKKTGSYPHPEAKKAAQAQIADILDDARRKGIIKSPPRGANQSP